ncbi:OmpH family outer membrane protein [Candidatus Pelagibacter sp.]|nr:OmpH family outer membrane protein [Candidatus Pelagibacter sp.]
MKKFFIILLILLNQVNFVYAEVNIVFVDLNKIMTTSKPGSSILENLNKENDQLLNNFKKDQKKLKDDEIKLISQKNILSEEEFQSKVKKLKIEINTYNENRKKTINDFNILKAETTDKFMKMINSIFIKYSNDKSISMIFDKKNMIIGKSELDITDEIIKIVNNEIKEFKIK